MANSERNIVVRIRAEFGRFKADMAAAAAAAEDTGKKTEAAGARAGSAMGRLAQDATKHRAAWESTGTAVTVGSLAIVAGVGLAIAKYAQFEQAMSKVQAATHASAGDMEQLRAAAISAGADTAYSAEEAAGAIEELAKAGVSTKDILGGGLAGALALAAAGEMDVAAAAETAASAMTQFGLKGEDIPHIADLLSAAAGKAQGSVTDMAAALNQSGLVAAGMGLSIEETTGTLASFASAGLLGSDAGTSFKTMLQRLNPTTEAAASKMAELGISAYDSQGNFVGMATVAEQLKTGMSGLSEEARASAMNIIFGSDAVRAANVLYTQGADGIREWTDAVDTAGFAAITASIKQDNLLGDIEKLGGALDTVFIKGGSGANGAIRELVQGVEGFVDAIGRIPEPVLSTGFALAGIVGSTGLVIGGFLRLAPAALETYQNFRDLGTEGGKLPGTLGKIAKGAGIAALAIAGLQIVGTIFTKDATTSAEDYANALLKVVEAGDKASASDLDSVFSDFGTGFGQDVAANINTTADAVERLANKTLGDNITTFLSPLSDLLNLPSAPIEAIQQNMAALGDEMGSLVANGGAEAAAKSFNILTAEFEKNGEGAAEALAVLPGYEAALIAAGNAAGVALTPTEVLELATGKIPARMLEAQEATALAEAQYGTYTTAAGQAAPVTEEMAKALEDIGLSADGAIVALDKYASALIAAGLMELSARDATAAHQAAIDANAGAITAATDALAAQYEMEGMSAEAAKALATEQVNLGAALNQSKTDFDLTNAAGRALNEQFAAVAQTGMAEIEAKAKAGMGQVELQGHLSSTYQSLLTTLDGMGITGAQADTLARQVMGIPPEANIDTWMSDAALAMAQQTTGALDAIDGRTVHTYSVSNIITRYSIEGSPSTIDVGAGGRVGPGQVGITQATGGFLQYNAQGTFNDLKKMDAIAQVVPANTWRVVGDNMQHPEVYAPLNGSQRSLDIMKLGADKMGYSMVPKGLMGMAVGGYAASAVATATPVVQGGGPARIDSSAIAQAVAAAMSGWRPMVSIGGADFLGIMAKSTNQHGRGSW